MKIELEVTKKTNADIFNAKSYPSDGLYLVDDGVVHHLVSVDNGMIVSMALPNKDIIKQYASERANKVKEDFDRSNQHMLQDIHKKIAGTFAGIEQLLGKADKGMTATETQGQAIDLKDLVNLVAVSQNADLVKGMNNG